MNLDRRKIVGNITYDMPKCVIKELFLSIRIIIDEDRLEDRRYFEKICKEYEPLETTLENIGVYVNPYVKWRESVLMEAYEHLIKFYEGYEYPLDENFTIGLKDSNNIYSYDSCMLYKICKKNGMQTNLNITINDMYYFICGLLNPKKYKDQIIDSLKSLSYVSLLNLSMTDVYKKEINIKEYQNIKIKPIETLVELRNINHEKIEAYDLQRTKDELYDSEKMMLRIQPSNHEEAIIISAISYGINIIECINPYEEYKSLILLKEKYLPMDSEFRKKYLKNPTWYDIRKTWVPKLSYIYSESKLKKFLENEGYTSDNLQISELTSKLQEMRLSETFYEGIHPNAKNDFTPFYFDDISSLPKENLISYGIVTSDIVVYSVDEIVDSLNKFKVFILDKSTLSKFAIRKLEIIAHKNNHTHLIEAIEKVKVYEIYLDKIVKQLISRCESSENKREYVKLFKLLLEMGMYMRTWDGHSEYPLTLSQCLLENEEDPVVNKRSEIAIKKFLVTLENSSAKHILSNLPLMKIDRLTNPNKLAFIKSTTVNGGMSILDRINIVTEYDPSNYDSCIRCSSNWFCGSAYYYLTLIGEDPPFNYLLFADLAN